MPSQLRLLNAAFATKDRIKCAEAIGGRDRDWRIAVFCIKTLLLCAALDNRHDEKTVRFAVDRLP